jgi:hypothetical protein
MESNNKIVSKIKEEKIVGAELEQEVRQRTHSLERRKLRPVTVPNIVYIRQS